MRGRQVFMESLIAHGVDAIFGNPGTTENPLLDSLVDYPSIKYYVALQESIAMSAASFYAQAKGSASVVNLHVAPGLGNAIGMMFGALKANSPVLVTAGQQDTRMRLREPLLSYDLVEMAKPVVKWSAEPRTADEMGPILSKAFKIAMTPPRGPVFISLPVDVMSAETAVLVSTNRGQLVPPSADLDQIQELAERLSRASAPAIIAGDDVTVYDGFDSLTKIAEITGAAVFQEGIRVHNNFPNNHPNYQGRMPFHASAIQNLLTPFDLVLLVGGQFFEEVWFDAENMIPKSADVLQIESSAKQLEQNFSVSYGIVGHIGKTLKLLSESLTSSDASSSRNQKLLGIREERERKENQNSIPAEPSPMHPSTAASEVIKALPTNAIVVDESITNSGEVANALNLSRPHQFYAGRGGGIGQGVAGAIGIQIAHPDKPVVCFSGDGSAMYSIQALWSASHHKLPILFIIWANREYRVLKHNLDIYRLRYDSASNNPYPHMDLERPVIDFVAIAKGHGVDAERIDDPEKIQAAVKKAFESGSPTLLEITIAGKNENERKS
jgi:benzoylformate decarboxylase